MKKLLSVVLCLLMVTALLPLILHTAIADTSGQCGDDLYWSFDESTGTLTITGSGDMWSLPNGQPWQSYRNSIVSVNLPDGLTFIGYEAFRFCKKLTSVTLPYGVTLIDGNPFVGCTALEEILVDPANMSYCAVDGVLFTKDMSMLEVYPAGKTDEAYSIPDGVKTMGWDVFSSNTFIKMIVIPASMTDHGYRAFYDCPNLSEINVDTGNVQYCSMDGVLFYSGMWGLVAYPPGNPRTSYTIPEGVTTIGNSAFGGCKYLTSVTFPDSLTDVDEFAFEKCYSLTELSLPDNVERIGPKAFNFTGWWYAQPDGPVYLDYFLLGQKNTCPENLVVRDGTRRISDYAFACGYFDIPAGCSDIVSLTIPDSVESIGNRAFAGCGNLSAITIGSGIRSISNNSFEGTAWWNAQEDGVVYLDYILLGAKNSCPNTVTLKDGTLVIARTATNGSLWYNVELIIPDSITELQSNFMDGSFQKVVIGDGLTEIASSMFRRCGRLKSVTIGKGVTEIGGYAFLSCSSLSEIVCPDQVMYIRGYAFRYCTALKKVSIGSGMRTIETGAFSKCTALSDVYYNGTEAERNEKIQIYHGNQELQDATWHYQSHALEGVVEWNTEDVAFKDGTAYVIADGTAKTPRFTVKDEDGNVVDPANYDCEYKDNIEPGTASVIVMFKGEYAGTCSGTFEICSPTEVVTQPKAQTVANGKTAKFTVAALGKGVKYQWYYSTNNGAKWTKWSGKTSASVSVTASAKTNGNLYRCEITKGDYSSTSKSAKLTVSGVKPRITAQPKKTTVAVGETATFKVVAAGTGLKYQWYYSKDNGAKWVKWSGKTKASVNVTASAANNGTMYRCVVKNTKGSVTSSAVKMTVSGVKPRILTQPKAVTVAAGKTVKFTVAAAGVGLKYQWQYSKNGGKTWTKLSGKTSATLSFKVAKKNNGWLYRCVVKNDIGSVNSKGVKLTVK